MGIHDFIAHYQILSLLESLRENLGGASMIVLPIIRSYHCWRASEKIWVSIILWPKPEGLDGDLLTSD